MALSQYIGAVISLITTVIAARTLGATEFGIASMVVAFPSFVVAFTSFKSVSIMTRYISGFRGIDNGKVLAICRIGYTIDFTVALFAILLIISTGWIVTDLTNLQDHFGIMVLYSISLPINSLVNTSRAVLTSWLKFSTLAGLIIIERLSTLVSIWLLLSAGLGVAGYVLGLALGNTIIGLLFGLRSFLLLRGEGLGSWFKANTSEIKEIRKELFSFLGWEYVHVTFTGAISQIPVLLLGRYCEPQEAGYFRLSYSIMTIVSYIPNALNRVVYPRMARKWMIGESSPTRPYINQTYIKWSVQAGLPISIFIIFVAALLPLIVPLIFGVGYTDMIGGAQIVLSAVAINSIFFWLASAYYSIGKVSFWVKLHIVCALFFFSLSTIYISSGGFYAVAIIMAISQILLTTLLLIVWVLHAKALIKANSR